MLLIDTHVLVWLGSGDPRLKPRVQDMILAGDARLLVSAVTAWEFADLEGRGRLPRGLQLQALLEKIDAIVLDFPASVWPLALALPPIHRDPGDRMLIAHALSLGAAIVTADAKMRSYPVTTIW